MAKKYDVAAYIWPSYTGDELRARMFWPEGYGEWQSVKNVEKNCYKKRDWYENDWKGRQPVWGYVNEANADVMQMQIDCAVSHGVNVFIYDWYWYDNRPYLENCLNDGFLKAKNNDKMKFYLMWANHDVNYTWDIRNSGKVDSMIWTGKVSFDVYKNLVQRWITKYFSHPSYYKIDGKPVFMLYDVANFIMGLGTINEAKDAIAYFREEVKKAGYPDVYIQTVAWSDRAAHFTGLDSTVSDTEACKQLGADAITHYQWVAFANPDRDYSEWAKDAKKEYEKMDKKGVVYFPNVSLGWDNNPRFIDFRPGVVKNATPDEIEKAFKMAKEYVDTHDLPAPLITVNSWNEWTETSYLQPDRKYGYGYLNAVKKVFVDEE
jgi:hypothetical protein